MSAESDMRAEVSRPARVVLGVTGGIAAYKAVELCRLLVEAGVHVSPVLTADAHRFIGPTTLSALASEPAQSSLFDGPDPIPHTRLGQMADLIVVAPATAKLLGKYAAGISDDLLSATLLATRAPVLVAPAMHTEMWEHPAVQANLATLRARGVHVVDPEVGLLAGGDSGPGRLADPVHIARRALALLGNARSLVGAHVLVTAGGTREAIDPVRYIGNRSSGKMGHAVAEAAAARGAEVCLVTTSRLGASGVVERVQVESAQEMLEATLAHYPTVDVVVMAAAVADFRPKEVAEVKLKKADGTPEVVLEPTPDILSVLSERRDDQVLIGFAAETHDVAAHAAEKLTRKGLHLVVANNVAESDSGFEVDTNRVILVDSSGAVEELPLMSKRAVAEHLCDAVAGLLTNSNRKQAT